MLEQATTIFMLGIAGTGMRGLAYLLHAQGKRVIGSDRMYNSIVDDPTLDFVDLVPDSEMVSAAATADLIIYSDAVEARHPVRDLKLSVGKIVLAYHEALGHFAQKFTTIAVTGTHGKSSTTALLGHIFIHAGLDPTVLVGARVATWEGHNAHIGRGKYFIVEADEYREHFLTLEPRYLLITSVDFDHPDYFSSLASVESAYTRFLQRIKNNGTAIALRSVIEAHPLIGWPSSLLAVDPDRFSFSLPTLPGQHMHNNAAVALTAAMQIGVKQKEAVASFATFPGLGRRLENLGRFARMLVISDYGHHPTEITATLAAVREHHLGKRVLVLFEAHTFERLRIFFHEFARSLSVGQGVLLVPVFVPAGREQETLLARNKLHSLKETLDSSGCKNVYLLNDYSELEARLEEVSADFDIVVAFTAGVLDMHLRRLISGAPVNLRHGSD